jgi:hypothetical protein
MSKLIRSSQRVFASGITPTGNVAVFGSLAAGSPAYSNDPDAIQALSQWTNGWGTATVGNQSPAFQDFNGYQYVVTRQLAYIFQAGIPEWHTSTIYFIGSLCTSSTGIIYRSKTDNNQGNAVTDTVNWLVLLAPVATSGAYADLTGKPTAQLVSAWVNFSGNGSVGAQVINSQFNVSSVTKTSTGHYTIAFTNPLSGVNYCVNASSAVLTGSITSVLSETYATKTTSQLTIRNKNVNGTVIDCYYGNVSIFAP